MLAALRRIRAGRKASSDLKRLVALWEELARDRQRRGHDVGREAA